MPRPGSRSRHGSCSAIRTDDPPALHRFLAERAGSGGTREVAGASHALSVSRPDTVPRRSSTAIDSLAGWPLAVAPATVSPR